MKKFILFTGASSFTGFHFVKKLSENKNYSIVCTFTKKKFYYEKLKLKRLLILSKKKNIKFFYNVAFGDKKFFKIIEKNNFNFICLHGSYTYQYNDDQKFKITDALGSNLNNIDFFYNKISKSTKLILSNSIFQKNEKKNYDSIGKYGLSKFITHEVINYLSKKNKIDTGFFFIPNPWGVLEERRFLYYLIKNWKEGNTPVIKSPFYIRDNIYVDDLTNQYIKLFSKNLNYNLFYPSGFKSNNLNFALKIKKEYEKFFKQKVKLSHIRQTKFDEPLKRVNSIRNTKKDFAKKNQLFEYFQYYSQES